MVNLLCEKFAYFERLFFTLIIYENAQNQKSGGGVGKAN